MAYKSKMRAPNAELARSTVCSICGRRIEGSVNVDHIYPKALYKWIPEARGLKKILEDDNNKTYTHVYCNSSKEDTIPTISELHIPFEKKKWLQAHQDVIAPAVIKYSSEKSRILRKQRGRCFCCGKLMRNETKVLRRIDGEQPRTWDNACVICRRCNHYSPRFSRSAHKDIRLNDGFREPVSI